MDLPHLPLPAPRDQRCEELLNKRRNLTLLLHDITTPLWERKLRRLSSYYDVIKLVGTTGFEPATPTPPV